MMYYTVIATLCLMGMAAGQNTLEATPCITKTQNLRIDCKLTSTPNPETKYNCYFQTENKTVASYDNTMVADSTYKNRANVVFDQKMCRLNLTGFSNDKPQNFTCFFKQSTTLVQKQIIVKKSDLQTCSAWCVLQHSAVAFLLVFLTSPVIFELL